MCSQTDTMNNNNRLEKVNNKDYSSDFNHALQYTRWFFTFLGLWPYVVPKPTRIERFVSNIMMPSCCIIMIMLPIPTVSHITLRGTDNLEFLILLGPVGFQGTNVLKYFILLLRSDTIKLCIQHMKTDWQRLENQNDRNIMLKNLKVGHGMTVFCAICMQSGGLFFHVVMPLYSGNVINELNETLRPLAYPGTDIYFDSQASVTYEIIFCSMCISSVFHFTLVTAIFNLTAILVTHACGQIEILMSKLQQLLYFRTEENHVFEIEGRINLIVEWHVRVLRFSSGIDDILRVICLMEVVGSTVVICLLEYYCMAEWSNGNGVAIITYSILLISLVFNIFIYCHVGELLKEQCHQVGKAAYMIEWYNLPGKTGLNLIMIIAMANYPRRLTAGKMLELSIITFGSIIRTTLAYLNMLRNMT